MSIKQTLRENAFVDGYLKKKRVVDWIRRGYQQPIPHDVKQLTVLFYGMSRHLDTLVETGTYLGNMVWAQKDYFKRVFSIELSEELFQKARKRFAADENVFLLQGDSSEKLAEVVEELSAPALFWLDGHYSGGITARGEKDCPVYGELAHIFRSPHRHTILIDDARDFVGEGDYPSLDELRNHTASNSPYRMRVENDIIVLSTEEDR